MGHWGKSSHYEAGLPATFGNVKLEARPQASLSACQRRSPAIIHRPCVEVWEAHCIDALVLGYSAVGSEPRPDNMRLVCISPLTWHHRQLHRFEPEKGGKRKLYGSTFSQGMKRGTLVKHPKWGKAYVGGTMDGKLSLHYPQTGKRLTQSAKVADCRLIKLLWWKTRLAPLATAKKGTLASSPAE